MTAAGVDYSSGHPGGAALKAADKVFAARYVSHTPAKNITAAEAADLAAHGVSTVLVWETTANRALAGRGAGIADAHDALTQATAAGMPAGRPLYFAVDWDATEAQQAQISAYFDGAASVLGVARVGIYGGYWPVKRALDGKHASFAWQTRAWSGTNWDPRAHIRQTGTQKINGVSCDINTAYVTDYGQWMPGQAPITEDDMPSAEDIAKAVWASPFLSPADPKGPTRSAATFLRYGDSHTVQILNAVKAQGAATATAVVQALTPLIGSDVDTAEVVAAVESAIASAVVHVEITTVTPPDDEPAAS